MSNQTDFYVAQLNARLMPVDRGATFEDPLDEALKRFGIGGTAGAGTALYESGEVKHSDIEIEIAKGHPDAAPTIIRVLESLGAPKGSKLRIDGNEIPFGQTEGLALYLNGSDLPDEVYQTSDVNYVYDELNRLVDGEGMVFSYWQGPTETALYLYGTSFESMKAKIAPLIDTYPLCQKCRIVQIA